MATKSKKNAEPKLKKVAPVAQFKIPTRSVYCISPLELASEAGAVGRFVNDPPDASSLEGVVVGDFLAVRNEDCDETFIIHKDVLKELAEAIN